MITGAKNLPLDLEAAWDGEKATQALREWASKDGSGKKETVDWSKYSRGFVYQAPELEEDFTGYKLPFATVDPTGTLKATLGGVNAVFGALRGARGGVDIPESDRKAALAFINTYRARFEELKEREEKATEGTQTLPATEQRLRFAFPITLEEREHEVLIELIRIGEWEHKEAKNGVLTVTSELLNEFVENFKNQVVGKELPLDLEHEVDGSHAVGWLTHLTRNNGSIFARLDITDKKVQEDLRSRSLKYISPQLIMGYKDPESGETYNIIRSAGLTNYPYIKNLGEAIVNFAEISEGRNTELRQNNHALFLAEKRAETCAEMARTFLHKYDEQLKIRKVEGVQMQLERLTGAGKLTPAEYNDTRQILLAGGESAKAHLRLIENREAIFELGQRGILTAQKERPMQRIKQLQAIIDEGRLPPDQLEKAMKELDGIASKYDKQRRR